MKTFSEVSLLESSLSRVLQHITGNKEFGVISAFRPDNSDKENKEAHKDLAFAVRRAGFGFIPLRGGYTGKEGFVSEKSLFIPEVDRKTIIKWGVIFKQETVIHKDASSFAMIGTNKRFGVGKVVDKFATKGKAIAVDDVGNRLTDFFSTLLKGSQRGKKFLFKIEEEVHTGMYYRMIHGELWQKVFERKITN